MPETDRSQLLMIDPAREAQLGLRTFDKLKAETPVSRSQAQTAQVHRVGGRIAVVVPTPGYQWEFVLFDAPDTANAFALPGGKVGIYSGILPIARDDAGLATVIAHEIAHVIAHHGGERMSQGLLMQMGGVALSAALGSQAAATRELAMQAYGLGTQVGVTLPYSRTQELEADQLGLLYMARAGYDPREAVAFWRRFQEANRARGGAPPEFLSTHPVDSRRIAQLEQMMPRAVDEYERAIAQR
ncbi:M48 family metallopeptidase [Thioflavicoccus mobilis]|uniref:M48 family metallopeptidase n=1 Tax=Thioflavicoccus mobilis TaxID=80679 RepID=UPI0002DDFACC|nr:M48 family metallopeptidase [Thioflavicoccus mobilis]